MINRDKSGFNHFLPKFQMYTNVDSKYQFINLKDFYSWVKKNHTIKHQIMVSLCAKAPKKTLNNIQEK